MKPLLLLTLSIFFQLTLFAQTPPIKGRVIGDSTGAGIPDHNLSISNNGYTTQNITATNTAPLVIRLKRTAKDLEDVVVIGYQSVKRRDLLASVSSVTSRQLKDIPLNSAEESLAGRLAGVQVTGSEGSPNAQVLIRVRGGGSITQDNSPLYVVDGIQVDNALSSISVQDIESIDVLKDAASTAIYGARGANGVVIITTKGGHNTGGRSTITYNGFVGIAKLPKELPVLSPNDYKTSSTSVTGIQFGNSLYNLRPGSSLSGYTRALWVSKAISNVLNATGSSSGYAFYFKENHSELLPIPQAALDANHNISQDYGY